MKKFAIIFLISVFSVFAFFEIKENNQLEVLKVISPTEIILDYNHNQKEDSNEHYCLKTVISFNTKNNNQNQLKALKLTNEEAIKLGYLAENFAKSKLENKKIQLKNKTVYINNKNYEEILLNEGLALKNGEPLSPKIKQNLQKATELNLVILNNKNHKYHKINCKYGLLARNSQVIQQKQLTKDSMPCKFCFSKKKPSSKFEKQVLKDEMSIRLKRPPLSYRTENLKIFLTDFNTQKPDNKCNTDLCKSILTEINSSKSSVDFAIYGYTKVPAIENALKNAQDRGVRIRFVYDLNNNQNPYPDTLYLSKIFTSNASDLAPAIMHNKFFIIDNKKVFTGSANISNTDMSGFNSNAAILINSEYFAEIYTEEFEQMYNQKFHKQKTKIQKGKISLNKTELNCYFSPKDKPITKQVIPLINNAKKYIYIPAFLITHKELTASLIKAKSRGVDVKIILDATNTHKKSHSKIIELRSAKIPVKTEIFAGKLHSKSIIIDDLYTIIGSMNFSRSGEDVNDENILIIKDANITKFYKAYFEYLWQKIPEKWLYLNARAESPDSIGSCNDGVDNDFDGKIDKADDSCRRN